MRNFIIGLIFGVIITCIGAFFWNDKQVELLDREKEREIDSLKLVYQKEIEYLSKEADSLYELSEKLDTVYLYLQENEKHDINSVDSIPYDSLVRAIRLSLIYD